MDQQPQEISGEEYRQMSVSSRQPKSSHTRTVRIPIIWLIIVIVVGALGFFIGDRYGKDHAPKAASTTATNSRVGGFSGGGFGGVGNRGLNVIGTVSSVSSSSITVQNQRSTVSSTYTITSNTQITDNGQSVTYTDIQTGDTVIITKSSTSSSDASSIMVNPSFGGGFGRPPGVSSGTGTTD